jgi:hypothetical protein
MDDRFSRPLGQEEADLAPDGDRVGRFRQAAVDPAVAREIDGRPVGVVRGQQDLDDGVGVLEDLVEEPQQLRALHPGQFLVDDEDVDLGQGLDEVDRLDAARRRVDGIDVPQGPLELFEIGEVVVDDKDDGEGRLRRLFHLGLRHLGAGLRVGNDGPAGIEKPGNRAENQTTRCRTTPNFVGQHDRPHKI